MVRTVNILGTEYRIEIHKRSEDEYMRKNGADGYCSDDAKLIVIADTSENESFPDMTDIEQSAYRKRLLRHEITHSYDFRWDWNCPLRDLGICQYINWK